MNFSVVPSLCTINYTSYRHIILRHSGVHVFQRNIVKEIELALCARGSNAIALRSAPSSVVVMNCTVSDPGTTTTQRVSSQQTSAGCYQTWLPKAPLAAQSLSSMGQFPMTVRSRLICPLQRRLLPRASKKALTHFLPRTWRVSMASLARLKQCIGDDAPFILDGGLATELEAQGVSLLVRDARGGLGWM